MLSKGEELHLSRDLTQERQEELTEEKQRALQTSVVQETVR